MWVGLSIGIAHEDAKQVYLIGLKSYLTRSWPYFGADVATQVQIPGALQGLAIAVPLSLAPIPESPFVALNLLSFSALCFFAWYCSRRLPTIPAGLIWAWLLTAPWAIDHSTEVYNPSYVLTGSILFFVGFLEVHPSFRRGLLPLASAGFMMGLGLSWVMQFHLSFAILLPYVASAFHSRFRRAAASVAAPCLAFVGGVLLVGLFAVPTYLRFGWQAGTQISMIRANTGLPVRHWDDALNTALRFIAFSTMEVPRFLGRDLAERLDFLRRHPWVSPVVVLLGLMGVLQTVAIVVIAALGKKPHLTDWWSMRRLFLATIGLLYLGFALSRKAPHAHAFYVTFPLAMLFALYCWEEYLRRPPYRVAAACLIVASVLFQVVLSMDMQARHPWRVDRARIEAALTDRDYRILGERRPGSFY
jgi:hypothetical protein